MEGKKVPEYIEIVKEINADEYLERHYNVEWVTDSSKLRQAACILPGHKEKEPSLSYYKDTNTLTCFGCKQVTKSGLIDFVALMEGKETTGQDFIDILKIICDNEGIPFQLQSTPSDPEKTRLKAFKTNVAIAYGKELWDDKTSYAFNYLLGRGFTEQTIRDFRLGVTSQNESRYGRAGISNRICIPILDSRGKSVIACSFRKLDESDSSPKYIHDTNDKVFTKREVLYGWSHAYPHIRKKKHVYIVEGYFDMIALYQAGLKNTVACMSNELTVEQIELIAKATKNVTIILDQDKPALDGFQSKLQAMLNRGLNVRVVKTLNFNGKDANDLCIKLDWDNMKIEAFLNANDEDSIQFMLSKILDKHDDIMLKVRDSALRSSTALMDCIQDDIKRKNFESYLYKRIGL